MAFTKIVPAGINTTNSYTLQELNTVGVLTAGTIQVGSATTIHSTGIDLGSAGIVTAMTMSAMYGNFTGDVNAANFIGNGSNLSGIDATAIKDENGAVKIQGNPSGAVHSGVSTFYDIDVDAHAYLDNVNISGVATFSDSLIVSKNSSTMPPIQINNLDMTSNTNQPFLYFSSGSGSKGSIGVNYGDSTTYIHGQNGIKFRYGGSAPGTTEVLGITSTGKCEVYKGTSATGKTSGSEAFTVGNGAGNKRFSVYPDGTTVIGGQGIIGNYNILLQNDGQSYFGARMKIGTVTEGEANADDLTIATSAHTGMTIRSGTANRGNIYFSDGTSGDAEYRGYITYDHDGDKFSFATANYTRIKILGDGTIASGNLSSTPGTVAPGSIIQTAANAGFFVHGYDGKFGTSSNHPTYLQVNGISKLTIDTSGNIDVATGHLSLDNDKGIFFDGTTTTKDTIWRNSSENSLNMTSRYHMNLFIDSNNDDTNAYFAVNKDHTTKASATELFRVQSDGNVGVGTDIPLNGLDVNQSEGRLRVNRFSHLLMQNKNDSTTDYWAISARNGGELDIGYGTPDGNSIIDGDKLTITSSGAVTLPAQERFRIRKLTGQSGTDNSNVWVDFSGSNGDVVEDTHSGWSDGNNWYVIQNSGHFMIHASVLITSNSSNSLRDYQMAICSYDDVSNTLLSAFTARASTTSSADWDTQSMNATYIGNLTAGRKIRLRVFCNTDGGSAYTISDDVNDGIGGNGIDVTGSNLATHFTVVKLG